MFSTVVSFNTKWVGGRIWLHSSVVDEYLYVNTKGCDFHVSTSFVVFGSMIMKFISPPTHNKYKPNNEWQWRLWDGERYFIQLFTRNTNGDSRKQRSEGFLAFWGVRLLSLSWVWFSIWRDGARHGLPLCQG